MEYECETSKKLTFKLNVIPWLTELVKLKPVCLKRNSVSGSKM